MVVQNSNQNLKKKDRIQIQHRLFITITLLKILFYGYIKDRIAYYVNRFYQM